MGIHWDVALSCFAGISPILALVLGMHLQNRSDLKKAAAQMAEVLKHFPPHRHGDNGEIFYPVGMNPEQP